MSKYLIYTSDDGTWADAETIEEAKKLAHEYHDDSDLCDGIPDDYEVAVYKKVYATEKTIIDRKEDYTKEEWEEMCLDDDFEYLVDITFKEQ